MLLAKHLGWCPIAPADGRWGGSTIDCMIDILETTWYYNVDCLRRLWLDSQEFHCNCNWQTNCFFLQFIFTQFLQLLLTIVFSCKLFDKQIVFQQIDKQLQNKLHASNNADVNVLWNSSHCVVIERLLNYYCVLPLWRPLLSVHGIIYGTFIHLTAVKTSNNIHNKSKKMHKK